MAKKKKPAQPSRNIPPEISNTVKARHFFQCAWCGTHLIDRHHIIEWSKGGEHTEENLILLCPNCHRKVHQGKIPEDELVKRKSTHVKGDRIVGGFVTTLTDLKFRIGNNIFNNVTHLIAYKNQPLLTFKHENDAVLMNSVLYDEDGNLVFWMNENYFWRTIDCKLISDVDELIIYDKNKCINLLEVQKIDDYLEISLQTFLDKGELSIKPNNKITWKSEFDLLAAKTSTSDCHIGLWIRATSPTEFSEANNEKYQKKYQTESIVSMGKSSIDIYPDGISKFGHITPYKDGVPTNIIWTNEFTAQFHMYTCLNERNYTYLLLQIELATINEHTIFNEIDLYFQLNSSSNWIRLNLVSYKSWFEKWSSFPLLGKMPDLMRNNLATRIIDVEGDKSVLGYLVVDMQVGLDGFEPGNIRTSCNFKLTLNRQSEPVSFIIPIKEIPAVDFHYN